YNALVQVDKRFIQAMQTVMARMLVDLPDGLRSQTVTIPVRLETDEGTYTRNVAFEYKGTGDENAVVEEPVSIGTGLFSLATLSTVFLGALIVIVVALIIYSAFRAVQKEKTDVISEEPKEGKAQEKPSAKTMADKKRASKKSGKKSK
ncbi:MAG: hypothetical protein NUV67_00730, partial [archaeon]|nr:hypothetical protein [archaeon]